MGKEQKKGLITDFDNTLVKTRDFILRHLLHTCARLNIKTPSEENIEGILKKNPPFEEIFTSLFAEEGQNVLAAYRQDAMETPYGAIDGALELVDTLQQREATIVIVSNRTNKLAERLEQAKFNPSYFSAIIQPAEPKPSQNAYKEALDLLAENGVARNNVYVLGDSIDDYQACPADVRANFYAVLAGPNTKQDLVAAGINEEQLLNSPKDLLAHIK